MPHATCTRATNGNADIAVPLAEERAREVFSEIERFFTGDWMDYQTAIREAQPSLFGGYEAVRLE